MAFYDGARLERVRASKQFSDGRFRNPSGATPALKDPPSGIVGEFLFGGRRRRPRGALPLNRPLDAWAKPAALGDLRTTWLGHSTVLLESAGVRVLTDPVFGPRASPVSAGPRRFHACPRRSTSPAARRRRASHDHFDHLCRASVLALARRGADRDVARRRRQAGPSAFRRAASSSLTGTRRTSPPGAASPSPRLTSPAARSSIATRRSGRPSSCAPIGTGCSSRGTPA